MSWAIRRVSTLRPLAWGLLLLSSGCASWRPASGPLAVFSHRDYEGVHASVASSDAGRSQAAPAPTHALASFESPATPYRRLDPESASNCRSSFG